MKLTIKQSYIILITTILITLALMFGWTAWVAFITDQYLVLHPDYEPRRYMPTFQLFLCFIFFVVNFVLSILFFRSKLWGWGLWLVLSIFIIAQAYFKVFSLVSDIYVYYMWLNWPYAGLIILQLVIAFIVRAFYIRK